MQKIALSICCLFLVAGSLAFSLPADKPTRPSELGMEFMSGLRNKDFNLVAELMPNVPQWKMLVPDQVEGLSDEEIKAKMEAGNVAKAEARFNEIVTAGKDKHIRFRQLEFNQAVIQRYYDDKNAPVGMEILFFYDHYSGKVKISAIQLQDQWLLLEILDSSGAFAGVKAEKKGIFGNMDF